MELSNHCVLLETPNSQRLEPSLSPLLLEGSDSYLLGSVFTPRSYYLVGVGKLNNIRRPFLFGHSVKYSNPQIQCMLLSQAHNLVMRALQNCLL